MTAGETLVNLEGAQTVIRDHFLGWQCRLRQFSVRELEGRPSRGMQPDIALPGGTGFEAVTLLVVRDDPTIFTQEFRHMVRRTRDPKQRYESAIKYLSSTYYQHPREFSDRMTALFAEDSRAAASLREAHQATLLFSEKNQSYRIPAEVRHLVESDPAFQATYWHNHLFNPNMPGDVAVLQFVPDWAHATADPPVY
ncbi:MAG: hypothetical protein RIC16_06765 [Rhodospirillales bacterium]